MEINYDKWCKQCTNYKLDLSRGIICKLTQKKPDFIEDCNDFRSDTDRLDHQED